jgi:heme-degrading monooxygenase HmoA
MASFITLTSAVERASNG